LRGETDTPSRDEALQLRADRTSERWVAQLRPAHPRHDRAVATLQDTLLRVARHELSRRRQQVPSLAGPDFDALAHEAAGDALMIILHRLDEFHGRSRFTTWAYTFVVLEVSRMVARHASRRQTEPPARSA
jgi:RNA polymerase sigma-70 factor, ECF subfamily